MKRKADEKNKMTIVIFVLMIIEYEGCTKSNATVPIIIFINHQKLFVLCTLISKPSPVQEL